MRIKDDLGKCYWHLKTSAESCSSICGMDEIWRDKDTHPSQLEACFPDGDCGEPYTVAVCEQCQRVGRKIVDVIIAKWQKIYDEWV